MPQITSGSNATFTVPAGYVIDVQCPGGWVQLEYPVGTRIFEGNPAGQTFGPYSGGTAKLTSVKGDIYYEVDPNASGSKPYDPSNVNIGGGTSAALGNTDTGVYNVKPQTMRNWRKAMGSVLSGAGNGRILCVGDSTTAGQPSTGQAAGMKTTAYPSRLAALLTGVGIAATEQSVFGDFGYGLSAPTYDSRLAIGSWTQSGLASLGGNAWQASGAGNGTISFTPSINTDTCEIYYLTGSTGSINANVNGGANTLINTAGSSGVSKTTITGTLGANTYNVAWASGANVFVCGFVAYNSAQKQISVVNAGRGSAKASTVTAAFPNAAAHITAIAPQLTIIELGINDWVNATSPASFQADMQTLITGALAVGDCLLVSPINSNPSVVAAATQAQYTSVVAALATSNGVPYFDLNRRWVSYADATAIGFMGGDTYHPAITGYADEARAIANLLLSA